MVEVAEPQPTQTLTGDDFEHQAGTSYPLQEFLFESPDSPTKTMFDHIMSQMINISKSVKYIEIENYSHRVMFDSFKARILKHISFIETLLRLSVTQ